MKLKIIGQKLDPSSDHQEGQGQLSEVVRASYKLSSKRSESDKILEEETNPEEMVELVLENGSIWYLEAGDLHQLYKGQPMRSQDANSTEVTISAEATMPLRGGRGKGKLAIIVIRFLVKGDTSRESTQKLARDFEDDKTGGKMGLFGVRETDDGFDVLNMLPVQWAAISGRKLPVLLMVHGTAASTKSSYSDLLFRKLGKDEVVPSEHWGKIRSHYGNRERIITFEHRSLTESPFENLLLLVQELTKYLPDVPEFHLISQSRGGQVAELLLCCLQVPGFVEKGATLLDKMDQATDARHLRDVGTMLKGKNINITKFVRVCCPAAGTNFLGNRLEDGLTAFYNLARQRKWYLKIVPDMVRRLVIAVANHRHDTSVMPGLHAMKPDSHTVRLINSALYQVATSADGKEEGKGLDLRHKLFVVQGNAIISEGQDEDDFRVITYESFQGVFKGDNDFIVDTDSMTKGLPRPGKGFYLHVQNNAIHHLAYYEDENVQRAIVEALLANPEQVNFASYKPIDYNAATRNRGDLVDLPDGSLSDSDQPKGDKPIVVLLPGIMGSNLSLKGTEVWVDYPSIFLGELAKLEINTPDITAKSIIKDAYGSLYVYLKKKGFDVVVFPYDWRKSIAKASELLNTKLEAIRMTYQQPIHLIAHSMGGLVARGMMFRDDSVWNKLKYHFGGSRCVLLGTPWKGSYLIPQVITGFGRTINALSLLDIKHTKAELLQQFVEYPGLLELLPFGGNPEHDFFKDEKNNSIWKAFEKATEANTWTKPAAAKLQAAEKLTKIAEQDLDFSNIIYVAGQSGSTVSNAMLVNRYGHKVPFNSQTINEVPKGHKLVFTATKKGDGSVTWDSGIPKKLKENYRQNLYFVETAHGELANDPKNFQGILELLQKGSTNFLSNDEPILRGAQEEVVLPATEPLPNTSEGLLRAVLGLKTAANYPDQQAELPDTNITVTITSGHLKYATYPLMVGHFEGDAIMNAEMVLDIHMGNALSARQRLGLYPGALSSSMVLLNDNGGAIVVGLGTKETLTQYELAKTVKMACLKYILTVHCSSVKPELNQLGLSTLMIGTGYANLSMNSSLEAIISGVSSANREILATMGHDYPQITSLEIVELYRDKAEQSYLKLHHFVKQQLFPFRVVGPVRFVDGSRNLLDLNEGQDWWARITAVEREEGGRKGFYITANSNAANVQARNSLINPSKIGPLLNKAIEQPVWNIRLASAMFGLFVPKDFQQTFRSQQNILWILDKTTAQYPLELMHYDNKPSEPMAVKSGMIRQLSTHYANPSNAYSNDFKALVIGDPMLDKAGGVPQLPGAAREAEMVDSLLRQFGYDATKLMNSTSTEVFMNLFDGYRVLHIASHGVVEYGEQKETGILISDGERNVVITTAEINQITPVPDLVFVNCCYLGKVDEAQERYFREKYQLAANIGTQFIENGAKAVVVAGWPVDDNAALWFAEVFYNGILKGMGFGEAVLNARRDCYETFGNTNTWGAYQCYGDPFFQLTTNGSSKGDSSSSSPYLLSKEVIIALEKWMVKAKSDNYYSIERLRESLNGIYDNVLKSGLDANDAILEQLVYCYTEIGQLEDIGKAISIIEKLMKMENANYSLRLVDHYFALLGKQAMFELGNGNGQVNGATKRNSPKPMPNTDPFEKLIERLDAHKRFSDNYARRCLLGDTYRRKVIWMNESGNFAEVLGKMQIAYNDAFVLANGMPRSEKFYAIYHWVLATCAVCTDEKFFRDKLKHIKAVLGMSFKDFLTEQENIINEKKGKLSYQDYLLRAKITECRLLFWTKKSEHEEAIKSITADLKSAFKINGSPKARAEQWERLKFVQLYVTDICLQHCDIYLQSINKLIDFLEKPKLTMT
ncbi:MAG: CHAT domain-containing protein [Saprospiraceae bacterium]|nr:CHAT domain-containing protein [Saprospiraceae bacterium]